MRIVEYIVLKDATAETLTLRQNKFYLKKGDILHYMLESLYVNYCENNFRIYADLNNKEYFKKIKTYDDVYTLSDMNNLRVDSYYRITIKYIRNNEIIFNMYSWNTERRNLNVSYKKILELERIAKLKSIVE